MNEKDISRLLKRKKVDLLVFGENEKVLKRSQEVAMQFRFQREAFSKSSDYIDQIYDYTKAPIFLTEKTEDIARLSALAPQSAVILLTEKALPAEDVQAWKAKGLYAALSMHEFDHSPKFEFLCLQRIRAQYYPISLQDIFPSTEMSFNASVRLPLNQKYLPVLFKGFTLTEEKYQRIEKEGRLYIKATDGLEYLGYIETYNDEIGIGLRKRCRALFLSLSYEILSLYECIGFDSPSRDSVQILSLFQRLESTLLQIAGYIKDSPGVDLWEVFRDALVNEIFNHWRAPWIAVYAGLTCHRAGKGDVMTAMLAACFADMGLMDVEPETFFEFVHKGEKELKPEQLKELHKHPVLSLNRCLTQGLPLSDEVKAVIACTHEREDKKGYPNQTPPEQIPFEAWTIQYAEMVDLSVRVMFLDASVAFRFLRRVLWEKQIEKTTHFPPDVIPLLALSHDEKA